MKGTMNIRVHVSLFASGLLLFVSGNSNGQAISTLHPENVIGSERCEECHKEELLSWKASTHSRSNNIHRDAKTKERAAEIATKMGIKNVNDITTHALCTECHFTRQKTGNAVKVISGVSCESCHGGAKNFRDVHGKKDEIASRDERQKRSKAAGMLYPHETYKVAENCYSCHIIRDEKLVNVGGHKARSDKFNLVDWTAGELRHNFYDANYERKEKENLETRPERKRMFFTVGMLLDLEHSLRALASGVQKGKEFPFRTTMGTRANAIITKELPAVIAKLGGEAGAPKELVEIQKLGKATKLSGESADILASADAIKAQIEAFGQSQDGTGLAALDSFLPKSPKGTPYKP